MAKKPKKGEGKKGGGAKKSVWRSPWIWMLCFLVAVLVFPATLMIFVSGMIPSCIALMIDNNPRRHAFRTVSYMNMAGTFIVALEMWATGDNSFQRALELLGDPLNWVIMFGMAAVGWGLYFAVPPMVLSYKNIANDMQMKKLKTHQKELSKEWGTEVASTAPLIPPDLIAEAEEAMKPLVEQKSQKALPKGEEGQTEQIDHKPQG